MAGRVRADEVLVEEARVGAEHGVDAGGGHHGAHRGELQHPERGDRVRVLACLSNRRGKAPQRRRHPRDRGIDGVTFDQIHPGDAQVRSVGKPSGGHFAALEGASQCDVVRTEHVVTITYYS